MKIFMHAFEEEKASSEGSFSLYATISACCPKYSLSALQLSLCASAGTNIFH